MVKTTRKVKVVLVDDHRIFRESLAMLLESTDQIEVVGHAADGLEGVEVCRRVKPDVAVVDITMPKMDGINATRQIVAESPSICVIGLSMHDQPEAAAAMLNAGAEAYVRKTDSLERLIKPILTWWERHGSVN